ncbi:hypothetical protein B0H11DRAFT_1982756 [Mycena galericulata]|nr:hypothetical protein B0H11DRAFT_1982756 [Mycena galericulata]
MSRSGNAVADFSVDISSAGSRGESSHRYGTRSRVNPFKIPKTWIVEDSDSDDDYQDELTGPGISSSPSTNGKGKGRERTPEHDTGCRGAKRRKVAHKLDFLEANLPHAVQPEASSASTSAFAVPSSDLLKCIHHFACQYYSDRGQLFNDSRIYRKARKQRRLAKLARKEQLEQEDANSDQDDGPGSETANDTDPQPQKAKNKTQRRDMYKTLDGSALLAVGMLLQEHIARMLAPNIPDGWEQDILEQGSEEGEDSEDDGQDENADEEDIEDEGENFRSKTGSTRDGSDLDEEDGTE